jgi:hypothetical protein
MKQFFLCEKLKQNNIKIEDFVTEMTLLNKELGEVKQKCIKK